MQSIAVEWTKVSQYWMWGRSLISFCLNQTSTLNPFGKIQSLCNRYERRMHDQTFQVIESNLVLASQMKFIQKNT